MLQAPDAHTLSPALSLWHAYEPALKADLFSTALRIGDRLFLVDPIPLAAPALAGLTADAPVSSLVLTNVNHGRGAKFYAEQFGVGILASATTASTLREFEIVALSAGDLIGGRIEVIALEGAAAGEIALYFDDEDGAIVIGDALIHFEPHGFALLPPKYCTDQKSLRASLRQLLDFSFSRLFFAHGMPIMAGAREKLETLLR